MYEMYLDPLKQQLEVAMKSELVVPAGIDDVSVER